ncbi:CDP-glucose 4,6-dehydratase [Halomonas alkaliantarctica]|uniref:CDP-glucose 4,6-dehydratase n=1 Tax=Halomonas alkaliantarctica TaxID=232346 RepID=A0ABY8LKE2_9GAMM|nr:CDP-glucose 4,6-dehydratase [Halomonas alkaliantarctica]WGI24896.1 CDP-glucose 4,6-dehydratase [Halomonas alkaliantarctica]
MKQFDDMYRGKRVLITGHTGFKGSWLTLWLHELGAEVIGLALSPENQPNHWDLLQLSIDDHRADIRDRDAIRRVIRDSQPEMIFHLAAQPLVRRSYCDPLETWSTNVMGTANLLEACREQTSVRAIVSVTTDKCYENKEWPWGYREIDSLGGHDPYSASKAGSELVAASYRSAFFTSDSAPLLATARAGNVIGGGDWSEDRLIPDLIRALQEGKSLEIRSPAATRPWQHVLESLSGYLMLGQRLFSGDTRFAEAWNFGPEPEGNRSVSEVLERLSLVWNNIVWHKTEQPQPHEANLLYLDSAKARQKLHWQSVWNLEATLAQTATWYRAWLEAGETISRQQLRDYVEDAAKANHEWVS